MKTSQDISAHNLPANSCVVIPAYNEEANLEKILQQLHAYTDNIVVVDDGSTDKTALIADTEGAVVLKKTSREGKGAAVQKGLDYVAGLAWDPIIIMDGDGQHSPDDIPALLQAMHEGSYDLIIGNRLDSSRSMPFIRKLTNKVMSCMISPLLSRKIPDTQCGFKIIRRHVLQSFNIHAHKFDFDTEFLFQVSKRGYSISSVPIKCIYHPGNMSYISPLNDTIRFLILYAKLLKERYTTTFDT